MIREHKILSYTKMAEDTLINIYIKDKDTNEEKLGKCNADFFEYIIVLGESCSLYTHSRQDTRTIKLKIWNACRKLEI